MDEPDKSTLRVVDQYKKEVLSVRYLNRAAIKLSALLYYPGFADPVVINDHELKAAGRRAAGNCSNDILLPAVISIDSPSYPAALAF